MIQTFDINVQIKEKLKKGLIFGLKSRLAIGLILGYMGYRHDVVSMMQRVSHSTRAYIWNAKGLLGFVCKFNLMKTLRDADKKGQFKSIK